MRHAIDAVVACEGTLGTTDILSLKGGLTYLIVPARRHREAP